MAGNVAGALAAGRFFRLAGGKGRELAIGRLYDPGGGNELAPLDDFGWQDRDRAEYRVPRRRRLAGVLAGASAWLTWLMAAVSRARRRDRQ